jgi:hypothetical protein
MNTGWIIGYIYLGILCVMMFDRIKKLERFADSQCELDKTFGEALTDNHNYIEKALDIYEEHLKNEKEIFEKMSNFLKEENKDGTL